MKFQSFSFFAPMFKEPLKGSEDSQGERLQVFNCSQIIFRFEAKFAEKQNRVETQKGARRAIYRFE